MAQRLLTKPITKPIMAMTAKIKKRILAIPAAPDAMPPNPKFAAINATTKKRWNSAACSAPRLQKVEKSTCKARSTAGFASVCCKLISGKARASSAVASGGCQPDCAAGVGPVRQIQWRPSGTKAIQSLGITAEIMVPWPGALVTVSLPPAASTLCRMPLMPWLVAAMLWVSKPVPLSSTLITA